MKLVKFKTGTDYVYINPKYVVSFHKMSDIGTRLYTVENENPIDIYENVKDIRQKLETD